MAGSFMTQTKTGDTNNKKKWLGQREVVKTRKFKRNQIFWPFLEYCRWASKAKK
jgi:hypothetical protein